MGLRRVFFLFAVCGVFIACNRATAENETKAAAAATQSERPPPSVDEFQKNSASLIADYIRRHDIRKVQLGAGNSRLAGWLNTDIEPGGNGLAYLDATKRFPFEDGSIHYLFSEHLIEHLTYDEGKAMMAEAYRVLAPGGRMRVSTPDLMQFIALFDKNPSEDARAYMEGKLKWHRWPKEPNAPAIILNLQMSSWGHKFMYDAATLDAALIGAGFSRPQQFEENISNDAHLRDLEERDAGVNDRWNNYETMSIEVEKPRGSTTR
jgi:predicted SAM-dependent methyltransferase